MNIINGVVESSTYYSLFTYLNNFSRPVATAVMHVQKQVIQATFSTACCVALVWVYSACINVCFSILLC